MGIWVKLDIDSLLGLLGDVGDSEAQMSKLVSVSYVLIAVGAVLLVIGFLGCCGAIKESRCMLLTVSDSGNSPPRPLYTCTLHQRPGGLRVLHSNLEFQATLRELRNLFIFMFHTSCTSCTDDTGSSGPVRYLVHSHVHFNFPWDSELFIASLHICGAAFRDSPSA